jgi:geranylgeranyl reductase family protein
MQLVRPIHCDKDLLMRYDTVIIGAGPAGIALGIMLQREGLSVVVIDKCIFPRDKLCGGLLTKKTQTLLKSIVGDTDEFFKDIPHKKIEYTNVVTEGGAIRYKNRFDPCIIVNRNSFDNALVCRYKQLGGVIHEGCRISEVDYSENKLKLSDGRTLSYRFLIGADGVYSSIRKFVDPHYKPDGLCFESYIGNESLELRKDTIYLFYNSYKYGYGWIFPRDNDFVAGFGGTTDVRRQIAQLDSIVKLLGISAKYKSMYLPFGHFVRQPINGNVLLIGDAAGLVNPITGEGFFYAFLSAKFAYCHVTAKKPGKAFINRMKSIHYRIIILRFIRPIFYIALLRNIWFSIRWKKIGKVSFP